MPESKPDDLLTAVPALHDGLVPVITQQWDTGEILMLAWVDLAALQATITTGKATYFSRSRQQQWVKGETSGNWQAVKSVAYDCDGDTVLYQVDQSGPACHTGSATCFSDRYLLPPQE